MFSMKIGLSWDVFGANVCSFSCCGVLQVEHNFPKIYAYIFSLTNGWDLFEEVRVFGVQVKCIQCRRRLHG